MVRTLQKELTELELATDRLYEAVEKDLLPMDELLRQRAQKLKARREAVLVEMAGARRQKEMPTAMLSSKQVEAFGSALRTRLMTAPVGPQSAICASLWVRSGSMDSGSLCEAKRPHC